MFLFSSIIGVDSKSETNKADLLGEIQILKQAGQHPNIVSLVGACTRDGKSNCQLFLKISPYVVNPPTHLPVRPFICPSVHLSVCPSVRLSVCPSVRLSVCPSVRLSVCPSVRLSVCPSVRLSVCPSVRLSVCPSVSQLLSQWVCPSVNLISHSQPVSLSVRSSVRLSICPSVNHSAFSSTILFLLSSVDPSFHSKINQMHIFPPLRKHLCGHRINSSW